MIEAKLRVKSKFSELLLASLLPFADTRRKTMRCRRIVLALLVFVLWRAPLQAQENDLAAVKAIFDNDISLFNAQNPDAFTIAAHDDVVLFGILSPFATKGKAELYQLVGNYFADNTRIT
jgi:hypothetical protein